MREFKYFVIKADYCEGKLVRMNDGLLTEASLLEQTSIYPKFNTNGLDARFLGLLQIWNSQIERSGYFYGPL